MSSSVNEALEGFLAGRVQAERLVIALTTAYYGRDGRRGGRERLRPLIELIDRASPGIVELGSDRAGPGFGVRLAERPFPAQYEAELRRAAEAYLEATGRRPAARHGGNGARPAAGEDGWLARFGRALRRWFTP